MTATQFETRTDQPVHGALVASRTDDGYRVYSIDNPKERYIVHQDGERWTCTCPEFAAHENDPGWRCGHILAVAPWTNGEGQEPEPPQEDQITDEMAERLMQEEEARKGPPHDGQTAHREPPLLPVVMLIKRSVSPDGRIDSVSVEFSMPVSELTSAEIKDKALRTLQLQRDIVATFLQLNNTKPTEAPPNGSGLAHPENGKGKPVFARMIDIGKVPGKWGDRLSITFDINGRRLRLFGTAKQLAAHIGAAGRTIQPWDITEGLRLNLACRVMTKPSDDGKYLNIEQVFPVGKQAGNGGANGNRYH